MPEGKAEWQSVGDEFNELVDLVYLPTCIGLWNFDAIEYRTRDTTTSGLAAAILCFRCRSMSEGVGDESDDLVDPENLCVGFGISTLSSIEREIQLLPVWRPAISVSGVGRCRKESASDQKRVRIQSAVWLRFVTAV
jgi:hypothetical protein